MESGGANSQQTHRLHFRSNAIINLYFSVGRTTCAKPLISDSSVSPSNETVHYEATYEITCNTGFTMSGSSTMICGVNGTFDQTPTCQGKDYSEI